MRAREAPGILRRRLIAVLLVLALTGSALAVTQQRLYTGGEAEAEGVTAVQQHSVFVEIIVEEKEGKEEIHKFAAVVGLIKKCKQVRNIFDNAVLWFNDQFLFGDKDREIIRNETPDSALGENPKDNNLMTRDGDTGRWGGCYTPDGFAFAIGSDDPYGLGPVLESEENASDGVRDGCDRARHSADEARGDLDRNRTEAEDDAYHHCQPVDDGMDLVKRLIDLDRRCSGCIFEYQSSFFITDPNLPNSFQEVRWVVDKMVYPVSVLGNVFQEGEDNVLNDGSCTSDDGTLPFSDPRDDYPHHDRCRDDDPEHNHDCTDRYNCTDHPARNDTIVEPLFAVHLQVDPFSPDGMGYIDQAPWTYEDGSDVQGMPISQSPFDAAYEDCKTDDRQSFECSIEYNFLLAVDFAAFDDSEVVPGEDEKREDDVEHGKHQLPQPKAWEGNSHPHNPQSFGAGPDHQHDTVTLDVFFYEEAPHFVMKNAYWDEHGRPPAMTDDCSTTSDDPSEERREAVEQRTPIVCDTTGSESEFHKHDGSQTID